MRKNFTSLLVLLLLAILNAEYSVGDIAANNSWQDSQSGSTLVDRTMQGFVDNKIVLLMTWGYLG